ncbi:MAG TPA: hypothetical protein VGI39_46535 [Polyangiaceae bacterium]
MNARGAWPPALALVALGALRCAACSALNPDVGPLRDAAAGTGCTAPPDQGGEDGEVYPSGSSSYLPFGVVDGGGADDAGDDAEPDAPEEGDEDASDGASGCAPS